MIDGWIEELGMQCLSEYAPVTLNLQLQSIQNKQSSLCFPCMQLQLSEQQSPPSAKPKPKNCTAQKSNIDTNNDHILKVRPFPRPIILWIHLSFRSSKSETASLPWSSKIQFVVLPLDLASGILITDQFNLRNSKWHLGLHLEDTWRHEGHHTGTTILHLVVGNAAQKDLQNAGGESSG